MGYSDGHSIFGRSRLSGAEGGASIRSRHPHRHHCRRRIGCRQTQKRIGRKRHYPVYRCQLGRHRGRCHLHPSGTLYSPRDLSERNHRHLCTSLYQFPAGRCAGYSLPYPLPQIFRERHARQVSLPRSNSHHTSARLR